MGYDLHLTRAMEWTESSADPVSVEEWVATARASSMLTETTEVDDGSGNPAFLLGGDAMSSPALYWTGGRVVIRGADESHTAALATIGTALGARLVGDDGETYPDEAQADGGATPGGRKRRLFRRGR